MIEQPAPIATDAPPTWGLVIDDLSQVEPLHVSVLVASDAIERDAVGRQRYGVPLTPGNGRDSLRDAYEESLDLAVYLKNALVEREDIRGAAAARPSFDVALEFLYTQALPMCVGLRELISRRDAE